MKVSCLFVEGCSLVLDVDGGQEFSGGDGLGRPAHKNAVHRDIVAHGEASHGELVFGGNALRKSVDFTSEFDLIAGFKVGEGDQYVVACVELEDGSVHAMNKVDRGTLQKRRAGPAIASGHCNAGVG